MGKKIILLIEVLGLSGVCFSEAVNIRTHQNGVEITISISKKDASVPDKDFYREKESKYQPDEKKQNHFYSGIVITNKFVPYIPLIIAEKNLQIKKLRYRSPYASYNFARAPPVPM